MTDNDSNHPDGLVPGAGWPSAGWPGSGLAGDPLFGPVRAEPTQAPLATGSAQAGAPWVPQLELDDDGLGDDGLGEYELDEYDEELPDTGELDDGELDYGELNDGELDGGLNYGELGDELDTALADEDWANSADGHQKPGAGWSRDDATNGRSWAWSELSRSFAARLAAFAVVAVIVVATVVMIMFLGGGDDDTQPAADAPRATPSAVPTDFLDSVRTDADPVVPDEFFGEARFSFQGRDYSRLTSRLDKGCPELTGSIGTVLTADTCRQLVRGIYLSPPEPSGRLVLVGVSVFVVDQASTAQAAAQVLQSRQGGVAPLPLTAEQIPGATVLTPVGDNSWRWTRTKGHYVILLQAAYSDGSPGSKTDPPLKSAIDDIEVAAVEPIAQRVLLGHGPKPPA